MLGTLNFSTSGCGFEKAEPTTKAKKKMAKLFILKTVLLN